MGGIAISLCFAGVLGWIGDWGWYAVSTFVNLASTSVNLVSTHVNAASTSVKVWLPLAGASAGGSGSASSALG